MERYLPEVNLPTPRTFTWQGSITNLRCAENLLRQNYRKHIAYVKVDVLYGGI